MEKLLRQFMNETKEPVGLERRRIDVKKLKLVRDGSIRYDVPHAPLTSPEHCLGIFRSHFRGAPGEMVSVLALNTQNQFMDVVPVAYGTLKYVHVTMRMVFAPLIGELNAASFIVAHNHPSGNAEPSPEDIELLKDIQTTGEHLECPMLDFIIVGAETDDYYSHREAMSEQPAAKVIPSKTASEWVDGAK